MTNVQPAAGISFLRMAVNQATCPNTLLDTKWKLSLFATWSLEASMCKDAFITGRSRIPYVHVMLTPRAWHSHLPWVLMGLRSVA
jgi:hypothetical protein